MLTDIFSRLTRARPSANADAEAGRIDLEDNGRWIEIQLPPRLLATYAASLGDALDPVAAASSATRRQELQAQHVVILIEECIDSDLDQSLTGISLTRNAHGTVTLVERHGDSATPNAFGASTRPGKGGYWSSHP